MTYPDLTLPQLLARAVAKSSDDTALFYMGAKITYGKLQKHVNRLAAGLQSIGVAKGDRVAIMMPNCPQFVIAFFGIQRAGGIVAATSSMYTAREVAYQWNDAGATVVIADRRLYPVIKAALPQLTTVKQIILTGVRQYSSRHFRQLCSLLDKASKTKIRSGSPIWGAARPMPGAAYIVSIMSSMRVSTAGVIASTGRAGSVRIESPRRRMGRSIRGWLG